MEGETIASTSMSGSQVPQPPMKAELSQSLSTILKCRCPLIPSQQLLNTPAASYPPSSRIPPGFKGTGNCSRCGERLSCLMSRGQ